MRSGLPFPKFVKDVGKSGPRKFNLLMSCNANSCAPCGLFVVCWKARCLALKSASMSVGTLWLNRVFMSV